MNVLSVSIRCASIAFLAGLLASNWPGLGNDLLPLAAMAVVITVMFVLFELMNPEPATSVPTETI